MDSLKRIPLPSLKRFSIYRSILEKYRDVEWISTTLLSSYSGIKSITIRKDIAYLDIKGIPQKGYLNIDLCKKIKESLGGDNYRDLVIIGSWGLGESYLKYPELLPKEYNIRACFDYVDSEDKTGAIPTFPMNRAEELIKRLGVSIVLLSVEPNKIESVLSIINTWDIKGILTLTPIKLDKKKLNLNKVILKFDPLVNISELVANISS